MNAMMKPAEKLELHPLCTLFPRLTGADFDALRDDIAANGLRQPIVMHDGMILDGGNRYAACLAANVKPTFVEFRGDSIGAFVLSANMHRRHLSAGQQAAIVASVQDWGKANIQGRNKITGNVAGDTVADRAAQSGASERTQRMADKVAKASPELARQVAHGEISLPKAAKKIDPPKPAPKVEKSANDAAPDDYDGPDLADLVDELQAENTRLTALITTAEADDAVAEAIKWRSAYDRSIASQSEAMDAAVRSEKREKFTKKQLMRCGKAVGVDDPTKIAAAVEAAVKARRAA